MPRSRFTIVGLVVIGFAMIASAAPLRDILCGPFRFPVSRQAIGGTPTFWPLPRLEAGEYDVIVETRTRPVSWGRPILTVVDLASEKTIPTAVEGDAIIFSSRGSGPRVGRFRATSGQRYRVRIDVEDRGMLSWDPEIIVSAPPSAMNNELMRVFLGQAAIAGIGVSLIVIGLVFHLRRPNH